MLRCRRGVDEVIKICICIIIILITNEYSVFTNFFSSNVVCKFLTSVVVTANKTPFSAVDSDGLTASDFAYYIIIVLYICITFYILWWWLNILLEQTNKRVDFRTFRSDEKENYIYRRAARFVLAAFSLTGVCIVIIFTIIFIIIIILPVRLQ